jgi:lysophospholipase L1-like esterase
MVFLGDSITDAGVFISMVEARLRMEGLPLELINLGLPSETCSGLSEPDHPFPRPNVQERLDRALARAKPDVVVVCYGMNDGIYHPFNEQRFVRYQEGINTIITKVAATGAPLVLMTPPAFDPLPMKKQGKLVRADGDNFAWFAIYENYDSVMQKYAEWVLKQTDRVAMTIDLHSPVNNVLAKERAIDPDYMMSKDGVHVFDSGHRVIADAMLEAWNLPTTPPSARLLEIVGKRQAISHRAWLSHVGHLRPGVKDGLLLTEAETEIRKTDRAVHRATITAGKVSVLDQMDLHVEAMDRLIDSLEVLENIESTTSLFPEQEKPLPLFNGEDLSGWQGDDRFWSVHNGTIRGANEGEVPSSSYLFTDEAYRNFRLVLNVKQIMSEKHGTMHSAVAVLGERFEDKGPNPFGFKGPLLMFCHDWGIWDAYRRNRIEPANHRGTLNTSAENKGDWNQIEFLVIGNRIRCAVNGQQVFDFTDKPEMLQPSPIGLQLHSNKRPQEFRFRNLYISRDPEDRLATTK